jgi:hypothetical protein
MRRRPTSGSSELSSVRTPSFPRNHGIRDRGAEASDYWIIETSVPSISSAVVITRELAW